MRPIVDMPEVKLPVGSTVGIRQEETLPISRKYGAETESGQEMPIGRKQVNEALDTLNKYRAAKQQMDARFVENERWWRMQHIPEIIKEQKAETDTPSAWVFNAISNKHADAMDNYPDASVLPREASDRPVAQVLSSVLPVLMERSNFEQTYSDAWYYKLKMGMSCYGVFWDTEALNGLGDVQVKRIDLLNLFWEPGIGDLQESRNVFYVTLEDTDILEQEYPELKGKLGGVETKTAQYAYVENLDYSNKTAVVDWYYRVRNEMGKTVLHLCRFAGDHVLYATENDPETAETGIYDHGMYPFVLDRLHCLEGTLEAFGYIDVMKGVQTRIDRQQCALTKYAAEAMHVRFFKRDNANINVEQYADLKQKFVDVANSGLGEDDIRQIRVDPIDGIWVQVLNNNIEELKEVAGNRDVNQGGTTSGVTSASGVALLMEASNKLSRDMLKAGYRAYREVCYLVLENIRQFYTEARTFRITAPDGGMSFEQLSNENMKIGDRLPVFDIVVKAQKSSSYTRLAQNEFAKELYGLGFFNPQMVDQAVPALTVMDFDGKEEILQMVQRNGTMFQRLQTLQLLSVQLAQVADPDGSRGIVNSMVQQGLLDVPGQPSMRETQASALPGAVPGGDSTVEKAKRTAEESTRPA